jgi:hypothetical protein
MCHSWGSHQSIETQVKGGSPLGNTGGASNTIPCYVGRSMITPISLDGLTAGSSIVAMLCCFDWDIIHTRNIVIMMDHETLTYPITPPISSSSPRRTRGATAIWGYDLLTGERQYLPPIKQALSRPGERIELHGLRGCIRISTYSLAKSYPRSGTAPSRWYHISPTGIPHAHLRIIGS